MPGDKDRMTAAQANLSRAIRFRAWDREEKVMIDADSWYFSEEFEPFIDSVKRCLERFDLMQFTSLLDKNGTEIYEGDVVKMNPDDDNWNDVVIFDRGHFELRSFKNPVVDCSLQDWCYDSSNPCIVIGNIHADPGLVAG